jgi:hypothetical protein
MVSRRGIRARLAAALVAVLGLAGGSAHAQAGNPEQRLDELERAVEALRAELAEARRTAADAPARLPAEAAAELERRIELLAAELEKLRLGEAAVEAAESRHGLGPAASKVYRRDRGVSIGGYGELLYQNFSGTTDAGAASGRTDELDLLRGVLYVGYKWNDRWLFNSELEVEHAADDKSGEVALEFAYVDRLIRPEINARAGLLLVPMGLLNELHEPTVFLGARRPGVENALLPTTWRENGFGVFGEVGPVSYRSYVVTGFDARGFGAGGLRGGRQKGSRSKAEDLAWVGRADWSAVPGLVLGGSAYFGGADQGLRGADGRELSVDATILEAHAEWKWRGLSLRALGVQAELDGVARLNEALELAGNRSIGERLEGHYLELGYDLMPHLAPGDGRGLVPYARWERYDSQAEVPAGYARDPANDVEILTLGVAWKPLPQLVMKADWQDVDNAAGTGVDQVNVALGYVF